MNTKLVYSGSPHIRSNSSTRRIMLDVVIALIPACVMGVIWFGLRAWLWLALTVISAVVFEFLFNIVINKKSFLQCVREFDLTSVVTGMLLGMNLSVCVEWYVCVLGSAFAIIVVKMLFGGTGRNLFNPAIAGRIFLLLSFTSMTKYMAVGDVFGELTIAAGATPLTELYTSGVANASLLDMFIGRIPGTIGETSAAALILGGIYLVIRKVIDFKLPLIYIGVTGLLTVAFYGFDFGMFLPSILGGGLMLGAIFMATDYVTTPNTKLGNIIYFVLLGALTAVLRWYKSSECVSYAIMIMNMTVPLFDRYIVNKPFGAHDKKKA
ncbi:MAG: RnfABCDGE type electron transport complex subunit D [Clostridia bacterium]|nr:RnfABCDGE type electron transport complex subunit D [Clostridia bacterium]